MPRPRMTTGPRPIYAAVRLGISLEELLEHQQRGERRCGKCREWQPVAEFWLKGESYESRCRSCMRGAKAEGV